MLFGKEVGKLRWAAMPGVGKRVPAPILKFFIVYEARMVRRKEVMQVLTPAIHNIFSKSTKANYMANELIKSNQIPITEIMTIGKAFVESGMFPDVKSAAQAVVKIQAGQEIGIAPFAAMTGIHIIQGKPTIGAGLIASKIKSSGKYDYKVIEMSEKKCSLDFYQGKELLGNSSFTIEDARKAQTKNIDKFPKNMLFARAISNGVKFYTPDVFNGPVYTPEEMNQVTEDAKEDSYSVVTEPSDINDDTLNQWKEELDKCNSKGDLLRLWNGNFSKVPADPRIKEMFKSRENQLKQPA